MGKRSQIDAKQARKLERATRHTFSSGSQGLSITEMIEERLLAASIVYITAKEITPDADKAKVARGEIRGLAEAVAMIRHPLRRYETSWWNYVKKIEKRYANRARLDIDEPPY